MTVWTAQPLNFARVSCDSKMSTKGVRGSGKGGCGEDTSLDVTWRTYRRDFLDTPACDTPFTPLLGFDGGLLHEAVNLLARYRVKELEVFLTSA